MNRTNRLFPALAALLFAGGAQAAFLPVCDRTEPVKAFLERTLTKTCDKITEADLATVKRVAVGNKKIAQFKVDDFSGLVNMEILNIRSNPYTELPEGMFKDLGNLKTLVIISTQLRHYPDDFLLHTTKLENLHAFRNQVRSISESVLTRLEAMAPGMKAIDFDGYLQEAERNRLRHTFSETILSLIGG